MQTIFNTTLLLAQQAAPVATEVAVRTPGNPAGHTVVKETRHLFDTVTSIFSRGDALATPDHLLPALQQLGIVWAAIFIIVGVLCMINGYRWYKLATVLTAMLLGMFAGYALGVQIKAPFIVAGCVGALLAVVAFPLMKYMVAALGGLAGAFAGANLWAGVSAAVNQVASEGGPARQLMSPDAFWAGAFVGLVLCGMLAFVLWKLSIVLFTSVSGSTIAVIGAIALLLSVDGWNAAVVEGLSANRVIVPLLVFVPAAIGLIWQQVYGGDAEPVPAK